MGKWEKYADEIEDEDALTKAPAFQDTVVDMVDPADATLPPEIRGCQVIERLHVGGPTEIFYCRPDGVTYFEAQATALIEAYRAAMAGAGAPPAEVVIDTLGTGDEVPTRLRGARLVDRGGAFVFLLADGSELPKEIGDGLFEAFESPEITNPGLKMPAVDPVPIPVPTPMPQAAPAPAPVPQAAETVIDTLGTGAAVPPRLRGARLVDRAGNFFFVTADGEALPKEIGDDLYEAWDVPDVDDEVETQAHDAAPRAEDGPPAAPEATADAAVAAAEKPLVAEEIIEFLGSGDDVPPRLRSGRLVKRGDGLYYVTADAEVLPVEIGAELIAAWSPDADPAPPSATAPAPGPLQKPFGYDDFGPVTIPEAIVPETIDVLRQPAPVPGAAPYAGAPPTAAPPAAAPQAGKEAAPVTAARSGAAEAAPTTEKLSEGRLEDQLRQAVTAVRREAATGAFDVGQASPTAEQLELLVTELIAAEPADAMLARMVRRSAQLAEQITEAWAGDEHRGRQALHRDVVSGTLLVAAVNPTQLKDLDVLGLVTLLRLRRGEEPDRVTAELARTLRAKLVDDLSRVIKAATFTDQVLQGARQAAGVVTAGRLWPEGVTRLVAQTVTRQATQTVGEVLGSFRERGYAFPGLAEKVLEAYRHFATDIGERVARALG